MASSACARLETSAQETDIVVHSGMTKQIAVRVTNLKVDILINP